MEPAEPVTLPCSQAKLGRGVRASVGHSLAPLQPRPTPGGVFVPPLSSAAPGVASPFVSGPRLAPQPTIGASCWSSAAFQPPQFPSAPLRTRSLRVVIARAAPPPLLMIPRLLSLLSLCMTSVLRPSQCPIPLLCRDAGLSPGSIPRRLRPLLGLTSEFTLGLRRWSPRCPIAQLCSTGAPSLCRRCCLERSDGMRLRISRILRPRNQ